MFDVRRSLHCVRHRAGMPLHEYTNVITNIGYHIQGLVVRWCIEYFLKPLKHNRCRASTACRKSVGIASTLTWWDRRCIAEKDALPSFSACWWIPPPWTRGSSQSTSGDEGCPPHHIMCGERGIYMCNSGSPLQHLTISTQVPLSFSGIKRPSSHHCFCASRTLLDQAYS